MAEKNKIKLEAYKLLREISKNITPISEGTLIERIAQKIFPIPNKNKIEDALNELRLDGKIYCGPNGDPIGDYVFMGYSLREDQIELIVNQEIPRL